MMNQIPKISMPEKRKVLHPGEYKFGEDLPGYFEYISIQAQDCEVEIKGFSGNVTKLGWNSTAYFGISDPDQNVVLYGATLAVRGVTGSAEVTYRRSKEYAPEGIAFVDLETTGLNPLTDEIWEIAIISPTEVYRTFVKHDESKITPEAAAVTNYYERYDSNAAWPKDMVLLDALSILDGLHFAGMVPSFDDEFLRQEIIRADVSAHGRSWHYHLIDIESMIAGQLRISPPWESDSLSRAMGIEPDNYERHSALGDALWARDLYVAVHGG